MINAFTIFTFFSKIVTLNDLETINQETAQILILFKGKKIFFIFLHFVYNFSNSMLVRICLVTDHKCSKHKK